MSIRRYPRRFALCCGILSFTPHRVVSTTARDASTPSRAEATVARVKWLSMDAFRVRLEATPLDSIRVYLGAGTIRSDHDEEGHFASLCYLFDTPGTPTSILFESGDLGGSERAVTGFTVSSQPKPGHGCIRPAKDRVTIRLDRGLRLGMSVEAVRKIMGSGRHGATPSEWMFEDCSAMAHKKSQVPREETYCGVRARFRQGRAEEFYVWQVTAL
jgi:hypothetical protein